MTEYRETPPVEDRPIQAGDWVECVDEGTGTFVQNGKRYLVQRVTECGASLVVNDDMLWVSRFKRVDGPHPVAAVDYGAEPGIVVLACHKCGDYHATTYTLFDGARVDLCRHCWLNASPAAEATKRACDSCRAPTASPTARFCVYCARRPNERELRFRMDADGEAARARNEAALRREAERPRGNRAERKSLAAGHPVSWPSVGDDEP